MKQFRDQIEKQKGKIAEQLLKIKTIEEKSYYSTSTPNFFDYETYEIDEDAARLYVKEKCDRYRDGDYLYFDIKMDRSIASIWLDIFVVRKEYLDKNFFELNEKNK